MISNAQVYVTPAIHILMLHQPPQNNGGAEDCRAPCVRVNVNQKRPKTRMSFRTAGEMRQIDSRSLVPRP